MTSAEIRQAIKTTMDFAPALMRAAEIVGAAEVAEQGMEECEQRRQRIQREIVELQQIAIDRQAEVSAVQLDLDHTKQMAQDETATLNKTLEELRGKIEQAKTALAATQNDHAKFLQSIEADIILKKSELEGLKHEMDLLVARLRA